MTRAMIGFLSRPWPWWVAGPLIGLVVPALLLMGGRSFGVSDNLRHLCAMCWPRKSGLFDYDVRKEGGWNLLFALGIVLGGLLSARLLPDPEPLALAASTRADLEAAGLRHFDGLLPDDLFGGSLRAVLLMAGGGFLVGFGSRYAGGCTSGHAIAGLANFQLPSLVAVCGFFAGGLTSVHFLLPHLL